MKIAALLLMSLVSIAQSPSEANRWRGAWQCQRGAETEVRIYSDGFFAVSVFQADKFIRTFGGSYQLKGDALEEKIEFDTQQADRIGTTITTIFYWGTNTHEFQLSNNKSDAVFRRLDSGSPGKLAGAWLITGRFNNGEMSKITPGARRTMKILSGTRFQWIAYNVETKEFFGTGGGTYTTVDGKYTENIDFFSRDQSRVGMNLSFDFALTPERDWRHSGKSSKGDPIDEVWSKREKLGM